MKIDLHVHTSNWSDGTATAEEMIEAAIAHGLDGIAIADHERMLTHKDQRALAEKFPGFGVFRAAEVSMTGRDHALVVGGRGEPLAKARGGTALPEDVRDYAARNDAFTVLNHPFWIQPEWAFDLDVFCPEAMDVMSMNIDSARTQEALDEARQRSMLLIACSDAHEIEHPGLFHVDLDDTPRTDEELVACLRSGRYSLGTFPELWDARMEEIGTEETLARQALDAGGGVEEYLRRGGTNKGFFERVARGASYLPYAPALNLRGDACRNGHADQ